MRYNKNLLLFLLLIHLRVSGFSQNLKIALTDKIEDGFIAKKAVYTSLEKDIKKYSGIDSLNYKSFKIRKLRFYEVQSYAEYFLDLKLSREKAMDWLIKNKDTSYILYEKIPRNSISFLEAIDYSNRIHFILDGNNNYQFDDDHERYVFDSSNALKKRPLKVEFEYYNGELKKNISIPYTIDAYRYLNPTITSVNGNSDTLNGVRLLLPAYKEGRYVSGSNEFIFNLSNQHMFAYKNDSFNISIQHRKNKNILDVEPYVYTSNQLLEFNNGLYRVDSLTNNFLYLTKTESIKYGERVGSMAPSIEGYDIMDGTLFSSKKLKGKYLLVNFWGSWCIPCIEELPKLTSMKQNHKKVIFVSIAADDKNDILKLKDLIKDNGLAWSHLFVERNTLRRGLLWNYKIMAFPTSILIDTNGKIVYRGTGVGALDQIDYYLKEKNY